MTDLTSALASAPPKAITHGRCGRWWTGAERSHCGGCCETFSSLKTFEAHRKGLRCNDPGSVGLVARETPFGRLWGRPELSPEERGRLAGLRGGELAL
jgi:hypothetical protein